MQLGFVSAILPDLDLRSVLNFAAAERFDCVEVMCWPVGKAERKFAGITHIDVVGFGESEARSTRAMLEDTGITLSALSFYPNVLAADRSYADASIDHLKRVIDASALLGVGIVNTFVGAEPRHTYEENLAAFERVWPAIIHHAEQADVRIGIENCPMFFTLDEWASGKNIARSPAAWRHMFEVIPSRHFGLNYDPSHLVWQMMDPLLPIVEFADRFVHVHAKDVRLDRKRLNEVGILATPLEYHRPVLPGFGEVDWARFFSLLGEVGYNGPVCIEVEDDAYAGALENRKRALRISRNLLAPYFG